MYSEAEKLHSIHDVVIYWRTWVNKETTNMPLLDANDIIGHILAVFTNDNVEYWKQYKQFNEITDLASDIDIRNGGTDKMLENWHQLKQCLAEFEVGLQKH